MSEKTGALAVANPWGLVPPLGNLDAYISAVNRLPMLTLEQEQAFARQLKDHNDVDAAGKLVLSITPLNPLSSSKKISNFLKIKNGHMGAVALGFSQNNKTFLKNLSLKIPKCMYTNNPFKVRTLSEIVHCSNNVSLPS